ncbi:MAG: bifunctional glycosyltransferase family 2/GtrA family protein [Mobilitalea sp.]
MNIAIIPAYNPDMKLIKLVSELRVKGIENVIVVNDGSSLQTLEIFDQLSESAIVLTHESNQGKGAAIKTALRYLSNNLANIQGVVILDSDGQHRTKDAILLLSELETNHSEFVLGVRNFKGKIPLRSLFGNTVTKYVFRLFSGKWISDTQTGLRAFSANMIPQLLSVEGERYEYEMNVLLVCAKNGTRMIEIPIATIYHDDNNSCSHFRTIRDSARIYGNLILFSGASFLSFLLDYLLFFPLIWLFGAVGLAEGAALIGGNVAARLLSAAFNYHLNSTFVFKSKSNSKKSILSYGILACFILALNTVILYGLHDYLGINKAAAKLITEMLLFVISFGVQRYLIFNKEANTSKRINREIKKDKVGVAI